MERVWYVFFFYMTIRVINLENIKPSFKGTTEVVTLFAFKTHALF